MSGLRILYHHRIRADDGQAVHVRELIWALRRAGHTVREVALVPKAGDGTGPDPAALPAAAAAGDRAGAGPEAGDQEGGRSLWQRVSLPRIAVECMEIVYSRTGCRMLTKAARDFRPDVIYERHALHCTAGLWAARRLGIPRLLEVNSPMVREMAALGKLRFPRQARRAERDSVCQADKVLPVTQVLADILVAETGVARARLAVVGNGAQPDRYGAEVFTAGKRRREALGIPAGATVLGFVGYARPWHRLDLVLEELAGAGRERMHLLLVGDGPAMAPTLARARDLGVAARCHPVGAVPPGDVPPWTCAMDAALIPAINDYASPLKLFDSLAAGVLTIAPDQPNLREVIQHGETGWLFAPGDRASLGAAVDLLARDGERARAIGQAGRAALLAEGWTWDGNAARVAALAREALR